MWLGAMFFYAMKIKYQHHAKESRPYRIWIEGMQAIAAGLIAGSALMGMTNAMVNALF